MSGISTVPDLVPTLCGIWAQVLALAPERVGPDSHFLLLGGDSLQLMRLLGRVERELAVRLQPEELLRFATPRRMAECCRQPGVLPRPAPAIPGNLRQIPATGVQQGIWLAEQLAAPHMLYLAAVVLYLDGPLVATALQQGCRALLQRHPVLQAGLRQDPDTRRLLLCLAPDAAPPEQPWAVIRACTSADWPRVLRSASRTPLSLQHGPLCRMQLFRLSASRHALLLQCHHVVTDGWSGGNLLACLAQDYALALQGRLAVPEPDLRFPAWCQRQALAPDCDVARLAWWRAVLAGTEHEQTWLWRHAGSRQLDWPHPVTPRQRLVPAALVASLRAVAAGQQCSLFLLFLDALLAALQACSGHSRHVLLLPMAQRQPEEETSVGCFVETLLLPVAWQAGQDRSSSLQQLGQRVAAVRRHQLPLASLVKHLKPPTLPDGNPWSSILFAFQSFPQVTPEWPDLECRVETVVPEYSQHALKVEVFPSTGPWQLRIEYATPLLEAATISALLEHMVRRLQQHAAD